VVAYDAPAAPAVAHDLRARAARHADFVRVHLAGFQDVPREVRIRKRPTAQPAKARPAVGDNARCEVREVLPQPGIARTDHGQAGVGLLDVANDRNQPGHAGQRPFRHVRPVGYQPVCRPIDVRIEVRIGNRDIRTVDAAFREVGQQAVRLGQVRPAHVGLVHPPPIGILDRVVGVHAACHLETIPHGLVDLLGGLAKHARAVFEAAAVSTVFPREPSQQFADEVSVATLYVHGVEADHGCELSGADKGVLEGVQLLVGDERIVRRQLVRGVEHFAVMADDRRGNAFGATVAAGVRQLKHADNLVPHRLSRGLPGGVEHVRECRDIVFPQPQLARVGPAFAYDRAGLPPDQPRPAGC